MDKIKHLFTFTILLFLSLNIQSQDPSARNTGRRRIDLIHADDGFVERNKQTGRDWQRLYRECRVLSIRR